jgi:hypothetical protein
MLRLPMNRARGFEKKGLLSLAPVEFHFHRDFVRSSKGEDERPEGVEWK